MIHAPIVEHLSTAARHANHPTVLIACALLAASLAAYRHGEHRYAEGYIDCARHCCRSRR